MAKPREMTLEECRKKFLEHLDGIAKYCAEESHVPTVLDKIHLAIFSVLVAIDGESGMPPFELRPMPHEDDREFCRKNGENWWPSKVDISDGELDSRWAQMTPSSYKK